MSNTASRCRLAAAKAAASRELGVFQRAYARAGCCDIGCTARYGKDSYSFGDRIAARAAHAAPRITADWSVLDSRTDVGISAVSATRAGPACPLARDH